MRKWAALLAILAALGAGIWFVSKQEVRSSAEPDRSIDTASAPQTTAPPIARGDSQAEGSDRTPVAEPLGAYPKPSVLIVVTTRMTLFSDGAPVPRVAVVVGVSALSDVDSPVLAEVTTDDLGHGEVSIPWSALETARAKPDGRLWARVVSEGFQHRTCHALLPPALGPSEFKVLAVPGVSVRGRLLDPAGHGVAGRIEVGKPQSLMPWSMGFAQAGSDGSFELHLFQQGTFDLIADAGEAGTAAILGHELTSATASERIDLHVSGPGIVRGHVRDSSGKPASGLSLRISLALLDDGEGSFAGREPEMSAVAREGRGRSWATLQTTSDGSFEARGLRADRYVVRASTDSQEHWYYPHLLTSTPIASDGADLVLLLQRPHIAVRLLDEHGAPFDLPETAPKSTWGDEASISDPLDSWPKAASVLAVPVASEAHLEGFRRTYLPGRRSGSEIVFEVEENRGYEVGWVGGSQTWRPSEVLVPKGAGRIEVTLTAQAGTPMGTILVSAFDPEQAPVFSNIAIRIEDPSTGTPLVERNFFYNKPWPQPFEVPAGEYRVTVEGAPGCDLFHGTLQSPRPSGRYQVLVRVEPGRESTVSAYLPKGAKVHLILAGEVQEEDREAIRLQFAGMNYELEYWANCANLTLLPPEGWPQPATFTMVMTGSSAAGTHLTSALPLGSDSISQILPAGRFRLEARMPGGRVASKDVVLVDGETTEVALDLGP
jgi:hypothetical protein